jgi:hypothetical protein
MRPDLKGERPVTLNFTLQPFAVAVARKESSFDRNQAWPNQTIGGVSSRLADALAADGGRRDDEPPTRSSDPVR